jgi:hypothetical protein
LAEGPSSAAETWASGNKFSVYMNLRHACRKLSELFLRDELGVSLHPEKTRIVHVDHGFEFLGYKVKRGKGLRLSASKRTSPANPCNLYAVPREKSVARFKDQIRNLTHDERR